jgi:muconate cycloisomerase
MRIVLAEIHALRIPFSLPFSHGLMTRDCSDSVIVKLTAESGEAGFGEGAPRPYVTGETVSSSIDHIRMVLIPVIKRNDPGALVMGNDPISFLQGIDLLLPDAEDAPSVTFNAARAAVETALIDLLLKGTGKSLGDLIPPLSDSVTYTAVISSGSVDSARKAAQKCRENGIRDVKLKVGTGDDHDRVAVVREVLGGSASLRVDANGAFDVKGAVAFVSSIEKFGVDAIEQPVPAGDVASLALVRRDSSIPVMADESLITERDAAELIEKEACGLFNLRISKNGGIWRAMRIAGMARRNGIGFQIGCQVGETAILSAAGRHLAAHLNDAKWVEGSYGTLLLEEDISREPVQFGHGGRAPLLGGSGLGIRPREGLLRKYAARTITMEME